LVAQSSSQAPFAHISLEAEPALGADYPSQFPVRLRLAPYGVDEVVGFAPPHGVPVAWLDLP